MKILTDAIVVEPFDDRVEIVADELEHAIAYGVSSILLAVYQSEFVRADVEAVLAKRLRSLGQQIERVFINEDNYDLPLYLRQRADKTTTVYSISGLRFGGGEDGRNAYRALNIRREYFVDDAMRVIFWLTEDEAFNLPRYAPDFWAFRHRTVEFMDEPQPRHISQHANELIWRGWDGAEATNSPTFTEDTAAKIAYREQLLAELPSKPERASTRIGLWQTLVPLYTAQGEYKKAISASKKAITLDPKSAISHSNLGLVHEINASYEEAITAYNQAIALDPKDATPHNGLGIVYRNLGRYKEAISAYNQAIALDPKDAHYHNNLGIAYRKSGRFEDAISAYKQAIALDPKYATPHNGLGNVYQQNGRLQEAISAYKKAIELDPKGAIPHNGLGSVYGDLGRFQEAISAYQKAIELDPKDAYPHNNLAESYIKLRQFDKAQPHLQERIRLQPDTALSALVSLGILARHEGIPDSDSYFQRALVVLEKAQQMRLQTAYGLLSNKATIELCLGQTDVALATIRHALTERLAGDIIELDDYELLSESPHPPEGLEKMITILQEAIVNNGA